MRQRTAVLPYAWLRAVPNRPKVCATHLAMLRYVANEGSVTSTKTQGYAASTCFSAGEFMVR